MLEILNQLFDMQQKAKKNDLTLFDRNFKRLLHEMEALGFVLKDPMGESFSEERTDIEANISGAYHNKMKITKVLKPIIYQEQPNNTQIIVQRGVVIVS